MSTTRCQLLNVLEAESPTPHGRVHFLKTWKSVLVTRQETRQLDEKWFSSWGSRNSGLCSAWDFLCSSMIQRQVTSTSGAHVKYFNQFEYLNAAVTLQWWEKWIGAWCFTFLGSHALTSVEYSFSWFDKFEECDSRWISQESSFIKGSANRVS